MWQALWIRFPIVALLAMAVVACGERRSAVPEPSPQPLRSILLVTLDTTRADAVQPESELVETPTLAGLAERGVRFAQAYATAPQTLPSHASILTGLYPGGHGVHENGRHLDSAVPLLQERLARRGYTTAAFVSGAPLEHEYGLGRGFDHYDDDFGSDAVERNAGATTDRALAYLNRTSGSPVFLWVHYYDPHDPYDPPEPFHSRYAEGRSYLGAYRGEIAYTDRELGRLVEGFEQHADGGPVGIVVTADHGEGLQEHGEMRHGKLLYQGVMRVPLVIAGTGVDAGTATRPVSNRKIFDLASAWARGDAADVVARLATPEPVLGEAMMPFLQYGWQPQVMAVQGRLKLIRSGATELYDVLQDPEESHDLSGDRRPPQELVAAVRGYPDPALGAQDRESLSREQRRRLATLGYLDSGATPVRRENAPSPRDMTDLFDELDRGSGLFASQRYAEAIPHFSAVLERDPQNLAVLLRLAVAHSTLGREREALTYFERAERIAPDSIDRRHYLAMHLLRSGEPERAAPLFEDVLAAMPDRVPALEALAQIRRDQGRLEEAIGLLERAVRREGDPPAGSIRLGELHMGVGDTAAAIEAFERARRGHGEAFRHYLELGVLYLAAGRLREARESLDRVPPDASGYPMALFKRAQVSVLLGEPDRAARIRRAWEHADATTRPLIRNERLFAGYDVH